MFSLGADMFPHSSPLRSFDFELGLDRVPSPRSEPNPVIEDIMAPTLRFPTPEEEIKLDQWVDMNNFEGKTQKTPIRKAQRRRGPIVLRPFSSCENTEFCVKTLTALAQGKPLPLPLSEDIHDCSATTPTNLSYVQ